VDEGEATKRFVAGVFDRASPTYDRIGVDFFGVVGRALVERAALRPGERVLELGCGRGAATFPAAERVGRTGRVLALDLAEGMVARTREDLEAASLDHVTCRVGDAESPDVEPASWDAVLASLVLFFLPQHRQAIRSYRQLLSPRGRLAFSWFAGDDARWEPVFEALVADLPEAERSPRRTHEDGPFGGPTAMDSFLTHAGYTPVTHVETVTVRYPDEATWRTSLWSHGMRGTVEKLRDAGLLEAALARATGELDAVRGEDGSFEWIPRIAYTVARP
jgi:ubiquinone/menaquinone biosynthesis C-methylase UbiE